MQRSLSRRRSAAARAKLAEVSRRVRIEQLAKGEAVWNEERVVRLQSAFDVGGRQAAIAAFPEMTTGAVSAAIRRYCLGPRKAPIGAAAAQAASRPPRGQSCWDDPDFHRRFLEVLTDRVQRRSLA